MKISKLNRHVRIRAPRLGRRGLTLIELMVGVFIALFLVTAAVAFASHETKLLGYSNEALDTAQSSRAAIDLITQDLKMAGAGVGYTGGIFRGLTTGTFTAGTVPFNDGAGGIVHALVGLRYSDLMGTATDFNVAGYTMPTQDLMILTADGSYATINEWTGLGNAAQFCLSPSTNIADQDLVILRSEDTLASSSARLTLTGAAPCTWGVCSSGCMGFTAALDAVPQYHLSEANAGAATNFIGGEIHGGLKRIVWFVELDPGTPGVAQLRRHVLAADPLVSNCPSRLNCGASVADNVEVLRYVVWRWNPPIPGPAGWVAQALNAPITTTDRLRVDLEIVVRNRVPDGRTHAPVQLRLAPGLCAPGGAACIPDGIPRTVLRTSVEIKNSGRMFME